MSIDPVFGVICCELFDNVGGSLTLTLLDCLNSSPVPMFHVMLFFLQYWDYFNIPVGDAQKFETLIQVLFPTLHFFHEAGIDNELLLDIAYRIHDDENWEEIIDRHFDY